MTLHLLKTDWQRLRLPILGVWGVLVLTTLPWLLHSLDTFDVPWAERRQWNNSTPASVTESVRGGIPAQLVGFTLAFTTLSLSAAIGMHGIGWQAVSPIRAWKRVAAKALSLLAFIVGPQLLLGGLVLVVHGFSAGITAWATLGTAVSLTLLHAVSALFAHRCGSLWPWLAGLAALGGGLVLAGANLSGELAIETFLDAWAAGRGPRVWVFGIAAIVGLALLPQLLRGSSGRPITIAAAVAAILIATFASDRTPVVARFPNTNSGPPEQSRVPVVEVQPESVRIGHYPDSGSLSGHRVGADRR